MLFGDEMILVSVINIICFGLAIYAGVHAWSLWAILWISGASWASYVLFRPGVSESIHRERAMGSPVMLFAGLYVASLVPVAIFYGIGRVFS